MLKKLVASELGRNFIGSLIAGYFRFVNLTCRRIEEPADFIAKLDGPRALVVTTWHGEHFMFPFLKPSPAWKLMAMVSRSRDGEINAIVAEKLGAETIRASGGRSDGEVRRRGGVRGFVMAMRELAAGKVVLLTADVPKVGKVAGEGVLQLSRHSGIPLVPIAAVTSRRHRFTRSWDRAALNLPFGRFVVVYGTPMTIAPDAGPEEIEARRCELEAELNRIHARAYEIAGGRDV